MPDERMKFKVEGAKLIFLNFSGRETIYNVAGNRNFCVVLDEKTAKAMLADGWNVKLPKPGEDEEENTKDPYLQVAVKYKIRPPKIVLITSGGRTFLTEDMVEILDGMDFENVDLIANASYWEVGDKSGIKAYLKTMYVTVDEDDLDRKYATEDGR